jgi:hypothetical protein
MSAELQTFLEPRLPLPGLAAWCARFADHSFASHCFSDWFAQKQVEQTVARLALAAESLGYHHIKPVRLCWVFEHSRIFLGLRGDGACLAFFAENRPDLPNADFERVLDEFARLPSA